MRTMPRRRKGDFNEEHWRQLLQRSGVAMVVCRGVEQEVQIVNDMFTRLFGYTMEDIPDVAHWWPLAYPDEAYREEIKAEWEIRVVKAISNRGEIEPMEAKVRCKDGSERYIEFHFSSVGDSNVVSFVDLTERKRAEIALRESEERFRLMADTAPVLVWMSGTDKLCTFFNKSWLDFTGRSIEQELGNGWAQGVHTEDLQSCLDTYRELFNRRVQFRMEYRLRHHDGEYHWVLDIGVPRFNQDGSFAGYIGALVDITERKMAEETLRKSEEKFLKAFRGSPMAITLSRVRDQRFVEVNDTFERLTGYKRGEVVERTVSEIGLWMDPSQREELRKRLLSERSLHDVELDFRTKSRGILTCLVAAELIEVGKETCILSVASDITDRKKAEAALAEMSRKLIAAQEQERARIGRELHDDINQRLGMLASELGELQHHPSEIISRVKELEDRTIEIANDVQALSHELHAAKVEYLGAVKGLRSWCKEFGQRRGLKIDFTSQVSSVLPLDIGTCLLRVLQEALHNAVKHSGAKLIEVQLIEGSTEVSLMIHDSGKGFDVKAAMQGNGLGLTSMQERVRLVNGTITIQSSPRDGTIIHASVPLRSEHDSQRRIG